MNRIDRFLARVTGKKNEHLSDPGFYAMPAAMQVWDALTGYAARNFRSLGLCHGQTVIDYGCGPGRYLRCASAVVGPKGRVIAVLPHSRVLVETKVGCTTFLGLIITSATA